tara:strand:- start:21816 stop:22571 length:756 start_codon:yes stop_codon:yes gene_type:complete
MNLFSDYIPPMTVAKAIRLSWASLANTSILIRLIFPVILALVFCVGILVWGWPIITSVFVPYLQTFSIIQAVFSQLDAWLGFSLLSIFALLIFTILIFTLSYFFLIILTSLLLVPLLNPVIRKLFFPNLVENSELTFFDSLKNSAVSIAIYFGLLILLSPVFIFVPLGQILVPYFLNAYLARRVFPYDVLQSYATAAEFERFMLKEKQSLWTLALLTGGYFYVPILNVLAAPLAALAFVIFSMGKISEYRR